MTDKFTTSGFADYFVGQRKHANTFLDTIHQIIDFRALEKLLKIKYKKRTSADGRPAYPALPIFKLLPLQRWYGLSDPGTEEALKDRISFIRFTGFSFQSPLPPIIPPSADSEIPFSRRTSANPSLPKSIGSWKKGICS